MSGGASLSPGRLKRNWRWYRAAGSDRAVAKEELDVLADHGRAALVEAIGRFRHGNELPGEVKKLTGCNGLWEIRVKVQGDCFRAIFFYATGPVCVCVTAIHKNQQRLPKVDRDRASRRMEQWQNEGRRRRTGPSAQRS